MRRQIVPWIMVFCAAMLDTTVIPMAVNSPYVIPLTSLCVMCIALLMGRMHGMLFGLFGGLLLDVTAGTLGVHLLPLIAIGYLLGLILYEPDPRRLREISRRRLLMRRMSYSTALSLAAETVIYFYQYFNTARFEWIYAQNCLIRALLYGAGTVLLLPIAGRFIFGKHKSQNAKPRAREVKSF